MTKKGWFREPERHSLSSRGISSSFGRKDASRYGAKTGGLRRNATTECRHPEVQTDMSILSGGLADGKNPKKYNKKQLGIGTKIEMEHTNNPEVAQRIAMDHLEEYQDYYVHLRKMEKKLDKQKIREEKRQMKLKNMKKK